LDNIPSNLLVPRIRCVRFWKAVIVDDDFGARFQSWDELLKHLGTVFVRLVVADPAEKVNVSILGRLFHIEIVCLEFNTLEEFWRRLGRAISDCFGQVLHDKAKFGKLFRQRDANESVGAANLVRGSDVSVSESRDCHIGLNGSYIDNCSFSKVGPWVVVNYIINFITLSTGQRAHGSSKTFGTSGILAYLRKHGFVRTMGKRVPSLRRFL
jgi:hypothetical protein